MRLTTIQESVVSDEYVTINNQSYKLFGVLDHQGTSQHSGHWLTWVRCSEAAGGWLRCDDSSVEPTTLEKVMNRNNYILAYQKQSNRSSPAKQIESNRSSPVKQIESNRSSPAKQIDSNRSSPAKQIDSNRSSPNKSTKISHSAVSNSNLKHPSHNSSKISTLGSQCATCGKTFTRLLQHLRMKISCQHPYDMEAIEKDQATKRRETDKENKKLKRKLFSPDKKEKEREKDREAHKKFRANRTSDEIEDDRKQER